jgi:hypothetical protein
MESPFNNKTIPRLIEGLKNQMDLLELKFKTAVKNKASYYDLKHIREEIHEVYEQIRDAENKKNND